jgi:CrcB protein
MVKNFLLVGIGGAIGSMLRYGSAILIGSKTFPLATLLINIAGSFIIGIVIGLSLRNESFSNNWKTFLATGICGGFTTFSAFSLENMQLLESGKYFLCGLYIITSIILGIIGALIGYKLMTDI